MPIFQTQIFLFGSDVTKLTKAKIEAIIITIATKSAVSFSFEKKGFLSLIFQ